MKRSAFKFRLILTLVILFFGYVSISALVSGAIRADGVLRRQLIKKEVDPTRFWTYTGLFSFFTLAACIALGQSFTVTRKSRLPQGPIQSPQRNAGSRPSSGDSSASETPSSLGPRG